MVAKVGDRVMHKTQKAFGTVTRVWGAYCDVLLDGSRRKVGWWQSDCEVLPRAETGSLFDDGGGVQ